MNKAHSWLKLTVKHSRTYINSVRRQCLSGDRQLATQRRFLHGSRAVASAETSASIKLHPTGVIDEGDEQFIIRYYQINICSRLKNI